MKNYSYPIDLDWSTEEIVIVTEFLAAVEQANESHIDKLKFMTKYQLFKSVVKGIGAEKRLGKEFEKLSGFSIYRTVQAAEKSTRKVFSV
ncbi:MULTISPECIES: UPF0223 family protein [unclassified Enterococcus]|uniref:UPF0223 family protein n=1 Tax=unclassified Enterococcus TaxID=2608891 RepID=UPI001552D338|nr:MULTISPECIES: UPF0223 family protein [unclassified Enterococcus]MBS7577264.1 UPF0223 family protein [Enterococcus sp. MMGLQ5-2]MBS7584643.1 UPF0223 family protein [Enterococcus sp. MMGLQ5-1]NPD12498.1 UPF0223 family protein [Enterococcus sp. MMGLQ5-1]NPD37098.1 UPF0223 family protein [Enterococcus sp. MMGLQ5-2]